MISLFVEVLNFFYLGIVNSGGLDSLSQFACATCWAYMTGNWMLSGVSECCAALARANYNGLFCRHIVDIFGGWRLLGNNCWSHLHVVSGLLRLGLMLVNWLLLHLRAAHNGNSLIHRLMRLLLLVWSHRHWGDTDRGLCYCTRILIFILLVLFLVLFLLFLLFLFRVITRIVGVGVGVTMSLTLCLLFLFLLRLLFLTWLIIFVVA